MTTGEKVKNSQCQELLAGLEKLLGSGDGRWLSDLRGLLAGDLAEHARLLHALEMAGDALPERPTPVELVRCLLGYVMNLYLGEHYRAYKRSRMHDVSGDADAEPRRLAAEQRRNRRAEYEQHLRTSASLLERSYISGYPVAEMAAAAAACGRSPRDVREDLKAHLMLALYFDRAALDSLIAQLAARMPSGAEALEPAASGARA